MTTTRPDTDILHVNTICTRSIDTVQAATPTDRTETTEHWLILMKLHREPVALILTRQTTPRHDCAKCTAALGVARWAYILTDADTSPEAFLLATGGEVALCSAALEEQQTEGIKARVVSMPSWELFEGQPNEDGGPVLPPKTWARVSVVQDSSFSWSKDAGNTESSNHMRSFEVTAPFKQCQQKFGFTVEAVRDLARLSRQGGGR